MFPRICASSIAPSRSSNGCCRGTGRATFFKKNLMGVEAAINRDVKVFLHQYEYDALVSVLFNAGESHSKVDAWYPETRCHHLAGYLNREECQKMGNVIRSFIAQRVPKRRKSEAKLFETGMYDASH
ncbi:glycoside hydrolase family protein [Paraburkholderia sp. 35.1]|uniref:glycoside hydrolase family protein n=1 Tax=Paraburkholderia sp. 35.1 TaxID=2991058 RepID=UPI003D191DEA